MYPRSRSLLVGLALPLMLALPACGKDKPAEDTKADEKPKVEKKDPATLFEGDKVTMPAVYAGLTLGMSLDDAKKAVPALAEDDTLKPEAYDGIWFNTDFDDDTKKLTRVYFNLPKADAVKFATEKWGAPKDAKDTLGKPELWWFNPEANLRMKIADSFSDGEAHVEFTHYWPVTQLIGGEGKELAFEKDAPLLGITVADLEAKYGNFIKKKSEEEAKKDQEDIAKLAGEDAKALMGKPTASIDLEYPPTEWGSYWTPVYLSWSDEGKVERFWFGLDFEAHEPAKAELLALFKAKWGEPTEEEDLGRKILVFSQDPRIEVKEDTISNKWDVTVEPAKPAE